MKAIITKVPYHILSGVGRLGGMYPSDLLLVNNPIGL